MIEGLTFLGFTLVVGVWVFVWGLLGSLLANSKGLTFSQGLIQGVLLGPVGVALIPLLERDHRRSDRNGERPVRGGESDPFGSDVFGSTPNDSPW